MNKANLELEQEPTQYEMEDRISHLMQSHVNTIKACNKNYVSPACMVSNWLWSYKQENGKESIKDLWAYIVYCFSELKVKKKNGRSPRSQARFILFEDVCVLDKPYHTKGFYKRWKTFLKTKDWYHDIRNSN